MSLTAFAPNQMQLVQANKSPRVPRRPTHTFQLRTRPFQIQPFMIAPVLPGETMRNLMFQCRTVSDPVKHPLIGWHLEHYWFYVKHRDLPGSDDFQSMVLNYGQSMTAQEASADWVKTYTKDNEIDYVRQCLIAVTNHWFRADGESWNDYTLDNLPVARWSGQRESWMDSLTINTALSDPEISDGDAAVSAQELDMKMQQYNFMRQMELTNMSYEDWLRTYGVRPDMATPLAFPELIRFSKEWSYPSNTVNPSSGVPSSALSWSVAERADKDRFFKEPGFIFGVQIARPKMYVGTQLGSMATYLRSAFDWLPAIMSDNPQTSLREFPEGTGPLAGLSITGDSSYWVDMRDLFLYGDQFINFALNETNAHLISSLPTAGLQHKYLTSATDIDNLFSAASPANQLRSDGICSLTIAGTQRDWT